MSRTNGHKRNGDPLPTLLGIMTALRKDLVEDRRKADASEARLRAQEIWAARCERRFREWERRHEAAERRFAKSDEREIRITRLLDQITTKLVELEGRDDQIARILDHVTLSLADIEPRVTRLERRHG